MAVSRATRPRALKLDAPSDDKQSMSNAAEDLGDSQAIDGEERLREDRGNILSLPRLAPYLRVTDGKSGGILGKLCLFFRTQSQGHCVQVDVEGFPAGMLLARTDEPAKDHQLLEIAGRSHGHRTFVLLVPSESVSKARGADRPGHFLATFNGPGKMRLRDLGSKNGTAYATITRDQAESLSADIAFRGDATVSDEAVRFKDTLKFTAIPPGAEVAITLPAIIQASKGFEILVY
jgi:hypothetical protein